MVEIKESSLKLYNLDEIKQYFLKNNLTNVILFSQARSGSTFVSNLLAEELGFGENFFSEEFFISKHFSYIKKFVVKHDNFFINTNEFVYRRPQLNKKNTLYIYLLRKHLDILASYQKAKNKNYYLGWEEMYEKYRIFFPKLKDIEPITLFNHRVWEEQIKHFDHALTFSYDSLKNHPKFLDKEVREKKIKSIKQIEENKDGWSEYHKNLNVQKINFQKKLKFNFFDKMYFKLRRILESRKTNRKNY